LERKQRMGSA
jgi:hypothetical protein